MAYELKEGQGSLFVNDQQGNPNRPNLKGSIVIGGQRYFISGWYKCTQDGQQYVSLKAELPQQRPVQQGFPGQQNFPPQGFQQTGQFPQAPVNQPYQQGYPQTPQYPQGQPQGNPFGGQFPPQTPQVLPQGQPTPPMPGVDDMPAF